MATQMSHPIYSSNSTAPAGTPPPPSGGTPPPTGSPQRLALDNLIRRELRVGDPNDPQQVAQALLTPLQGRPARPRHCPGGQGLTIPPNRPSGIQGHASPYLLGCGVAASYR
jgi:hypothetical protein